MNNVFHHLTLQNFRSINTLTLKNMAGSQAPSLGTRPNATVPRSFIKAQHSRFDDSDNLPSCAVQPHQAFVYADNSRFHQEKLNVSKEQRESVKPARRLRCSDATVQGLAKVLIDDPAIGLFSDEGGQVLGGYSMKENHLHSIASFCKLWNGDGMERNSTYSTAVFHGYDGVISGMVKKSCCELLRNKGGCCF